MSCMGRWVMAAFLFCVALPALSQNTKGDQPVDNQRQIREMRGKSIIRRQQPTRDISGRRLRTKNASSTSRVVHPQPDPYQGRNVRSRTERAARPITKIYRTKPRESNQAWQGDITGRKLRVQERARKALKHADDPRVTNRTAEGNLPIQQRPRVGDRPWKGGQDRSPLKIQSVTGRTRNVFSQNNQYVRYYRRNIQTRDKPVSNRAVLSLNLKLSSSGYPSKPGVSARSASRNFVQRGRRNVYWGKFSRGEQAVTRDIAGRPLRTRNYRSPSPGLIGRDSLPFFNRKPQGDRTLGGRSGGFVSTRRTQGGWRGDITGSGLRRLSPSKSTEVAGIPKKGFLSLSPMGKNQPLPTRPPGIGAIGIDQYRGNIPTHRTGNVLGQGEEFSGFIKTRRPLRGGGSISRSWNNNGSPIGVRTPGARALQIGSFAGNIRTDRFGNLSAQGEEFAGFIKTKRPVYGGGSISGSWNNNGVPIGVRTPGVGTLKAGTFAGNIRTDRLGNLRPQGEEFKGYIKARRPAVGGGSISGSWNNNGSPVGVRTPGAGSLRAGTFAGSIRTDRLGSLRPQGEEFGGYIKARRPAVGGGSVSGFWNNEGNPIGVRTPAAGALKAGSFAGNIKTDRLGNLNPQGEEFRGYIKAKRPATGGGGSITGLWNNDETPIEVKAPGSGTLKAGTYAGNMRRSKAAKGAGGSITGSWNNNELPIAVRAPAASAAKAGTFSGNMKQQREASANADVNYSGRMKRPLLRNDYSQNPEAAKESLKKNNPYTPSNPEELFQSLFSAKASANINAYQGNTRMRKYNNTQFHPDAQFAHSYRDNVKEERTVLMDIQLFWSKVFRSGATQPDHLSDKSEKPRYDKGEQGLWNE